MVRFYLGSNLGDSVSFIALTLKHFISENEQKKIFVIFKVSISYITL
jgi:hypothetical protein